MPLPELTVLVPDRPAQYSSSWAIVLPMYCMLIVIHKPASIHTLNVMNRVDDGLVLSSMDRRVRRSWLSAERVVAAITLMIVVTAAAYGYARFGTGRTLTVNSQNLTVSAVRHKTFHEYIPVTGHVVPRTTVYLDAIEGGQVTDVYVEEGAFVDAGQRLVRLKNSALQLQVIASEAQLTEQLNYLAATELTFEQSRLQRKRELLDIDHRLDRLARELRQRRPLLASGGVTQAQIDDLESERNYYRDLKEAVQEAQAIDAEFQSTEMARMREALDAMNANLDFARGNLNNLTVVAPISGQLTLLEAEVGQSKAPGMRIGRIDQVDAFKVTAFIDEFYLSRVVVGQRASVEITGQDYQLEIGKIYPGVVDRQFEVDLVFLDRLPEGIRRGQTVRMRLEIGAPAENLVVANGPYVEDTGGLWVFVVDRDAMRAQRRSVRLGRRNPEGIEVLDGLRAGEEIVTSSYEFLMDFQELQLRGSLY